MKFDSYWLDSTPPFTQAADGPVEGDFEVAVIGGGFTGLSAARTLARRGVRVVLLEAGRIGSGASGRNGGHLNNGLAHSYLAAKAHLGAGPAAALYRMFDAGIDTIEQIIAEEQIACDFRRAGKLKLASKPAHFDAIARNFEAIHADVDPETALLTADALRSEVGASFHGAMLSKKSAMMHMGRYVVGLAAAAVRHGGMLYENAAVIHRRRDGDRHLLGTRRGEVRAAQVFLASGAYTARPFSYFSRRLVPVGSFLIATRPLSAAEVASVLPGNRTCVNSLNIGNYFRLSPDNRLIFGGRARFSASSDQRSDAQGGAILKSALMQIFPQLKGVEIDYCWGGLVDMTKDRFPRAGFADGVWYAMGYSGHGAQLSTLLGQTIAERMLGDGRPTPLDALTWPAVPGHFGKPWFLPLVGLYYKFLDKIR